jgi:hypothetical protein
MVHDLQTGELVNRWLVGSLSIESWNGNGLHSRTGYLNGDLKEEEEDSGVLFTVAIVPFATT